MAMLSLTLCILHVLCFTSILHCAFGQINMSEVMEDTRTNVDQLEQTSGLSSASREAIEKAKQGITTDIMRSITVLLTLADTLKRDPAEQAGIIEQELNEVINSSLGYLKLDGLSPESIVAINTAEQAFSVHDLKRTIAVQTNFADEVKRDSAIPRNKRSFRRYNSYPRYSYQWYMAYLKQQQKYLSQRSKGSLFQAENAFKKNGKKNSFEISNSLKEALKEALEDDPSMPAEVVAGIKKLLKNHGNQKKTSLMMITIGTVVSMLIFSRN